jgi:hypothetical protein
MKKGYVKFAKLVSQFDAYLPLTDPRLKHALLNFRLDCWQVLIGGLSLIGTILFLA